MFIDSDGGKVDRWVERLAVWIGGARRACDYAKPGVDYSVLSEFRDRLAEGDRAIGGSSIVCVQVLLDMSA